MTKNDGTENGSSVSPLPALQAPVYTEVRIRQFYKTLDNGQEVLPSAVFYLTGGMTMDLADTATKIEQAVREQLRVRPLDEAELREFIRNEVTAAAAAVSSGKAALASLPEIVPLTSGGKFDA